MYNGNRKLSKITKLKRNIKSSSMDGLLYNNKNYHREIGIKNKLKIYENENQPIIDKGLLRKPLWRGY